LSLEIELVDPCLVTQLQPNPISDFTFYSFVKGASQTFAPFNDIVATEAISDSGAVGIPGLCGPVKYSISTIPESIIKFTISPPADGKNFTSNWTLSYDSDSLNDVLPDG
jgi:hypothetical protein